EAGLGGGTPLAAIYVLLFLNQDMASSLATDGRLNPVRAGGLCGPQALSRDFNRRGRGRHILM
ncbi:MAG TPA: hypothetical protein VFU32_06090, partial [Ktedonobacterales bacterium]|nr:hypothetical protein [Ktedonobacterales bacterium]